MKRSLVLGIASLAVVAGPTFAVAAPAFAADLPTFTPTTGIVPGTMLQNAVVTVDSGFLCHRLDGSEQLTGVTVTFGFSFYDSADGEFSNDDTYLGYAVSTTSETYTAGQTQSGTFTAEVPVLS